MTARAARSRWHGEAGVTLVEILVVLAIVSLALALAMPNLFGAARTVGLRGAAFDMKTRLGLARAAAISRSRPVAFVIDVRQRRYASEAENRWIALPGGSSVAVTTARDEAGRAGLARLVFYPDGSSTGADIVLRREGGAYRVAVDWLTGQASVEARP